MKSPQNRPQNVNYRMKACNILARVFLSLWIEFWRTGHQRTLTILFLKKASDFLFIVTSPSHVLIEIKPLVAVLSKIGASTSAVVAESTSKWKFLYISMCDIYVISSAHFILEAAKIAILRLIWRPLWARMTFGGFTSIYIRDHNKKIMKKYTYPMMPLFWNCHFEADFCGLYFG